VVIETFNQEKVKTTKNHLLNDTERQWIEVQIMVYGAKPRVFIDVDASFSQVRNFFIKITN
jgi:hypothetical protein